MKPIVRRILTNQTDPIMAGVRQNLLANRAADETVEQTYDRLEKHGQLGRLMVPVGTDPRMSDPEFVSLMPE